MSGPVVVTGAAGFLGTHLTGALASRGIEVRAVDVKPHPGRFRLETVRYARIDIRDTAALAPVLASTDTVYHLAAARPRANGNARLYREVNVEAAHGLVQACAEAGVRRLVHASTVGIHGHVEDPPAREDAPTAPGSLYERSRLEGEIVMRRAAAETDLDLMVLRLAWAYGRGCPRMAKLLRSLKGGRFIYVGDGGNLCQPMYVADAVDAFLLTAGAPPELAGRSYLVAGPRVMDLRELVETCARALGVRPPRLRVPREVADAAARAAEVAWGAVGLEPPFSRRRLGFFESDHAFDTAAVRRDLGFAPSVDLEEGVRRTVEEPVRLIGM